MENMPLPLDFAGVVADGEYRFRLWRTWPMPLGVPPRMVAFLMLNPSTADATRDDATVRRCIGYGRAWGFNRLEVINLFALRSTDPRALYAHPAPVGPGNDDMILAVARTAGLVVAAWGHHGVHDGRAAQVLAMLRAAGITPMCLGLTKEPKGAQLIEVPR